MSYTALYRKFRPDQFEEVKGQDHIVTTLRNQIMADRIGHAYLFTGTRGTGKTTIAKLFAKICNVGNDLRAGTVCVGGNAVLCDDLVLLVYDTCGDVGSAQVNANTVHR